MDIGKIVFDGISERPQTALILLLLAGILSSLGPCGAQRALGLFASTTNRPRASTALYYAGGIAVACMLLFVSTSIVRQLIESAHVTTIVMAILCLSIGVLGLWQADLRHCRLHHGRESVGGIGTFALGFGSSLFIAPCCTPFLLFVAAYAAPNMLVPDALAYSLGCALPYALTGIFARRMLRLVAAASVRQAVRIVGSSIALALGLLYLVEI